MHFSIKNSKDLVTLLEDIANVISEDSDHFDVRIVTLLYNICTIIKNEKYDEFRAFFIKSQIENIANSNILSLPKNLDQKTVIEETCQNLEEAISKRSKNKKSKNTNIDEAIDWQVFEDYLNDKHRD